MARILIGAFGDAGHAFPALGLARALVDAGHEVTLETWERWREDAARIGAGFAAAQQYVVFPTQEPGVERTASAAEAAEAILPLIDEVQPDLVISDILTLATALAAEVRSLMRATLVPHVWPVTEPGMPFFAMGSPPPRTWLGRAAWRSVHPLARKGLLRGRDQLNGERARLGLPPVADLFGSISRELAIVATLPQLEYAREWPAHAHVVGPLGYERPFDDVELPDGDQPLVLVAPSTAKDPEGELIRRSFEALAAEPVRVIATVNGHLPTRPIDTPANARLVDWLSYSQVLPRCSLVIAHGGHGTVCRALGEGVPVLATPIAGDMFETGARLQWSGLGRAIPWRACSARTLRWVVRSMLRESSYAERAAEVAEWLGQSNPDATAAGAVEAVL